MEDRLLVVGGGTMGSGIALTAARGGYDVQIVEPDPGARARAVVYLEREVRRAGDNTVLDRIAWLDAIPTPCAASVAIEAVPEQVDLKRGILAQLAGSLAPGALLATNTSSLAVADLAATVAHPERFLGLHFFNPAPRMALVEIVYAAQTADDAIERAYAVVERLGKRPVLAADTPGFIVNRVARPFYLQSLRALERGAASAAELDALARGVGFRMGPFELMDLIGLDVNLAVSESVYERTGAERFTPSGLQREMVAQGRLGRKTGDGFYRYADGAPERFEPAPTPSPERNVDEYVAIIGFGSLADELSAAVEVRYEHVVRIENDDFLDELAPGVTIAVDAGNGSADRGEAIARLATLLGPESVILFDAYANDAASWENRVQHSQRLVGYGVLGSLDAQSVVEIVNSDGSFDEALELAQEFFGALGKGVVLVEDVPGLFLGRTVGSIVNEAMIAVSEEVASAEDVDEAMRLGANYPIGPIAWGREIGGARVRRILTLLAQGEGDAAGPHRSLWMLDLEEAPSEEAPQ